MFNPGHILGPLALVLWIPFTFVLFTRLRPTVAGTISLVGGTLFLPEHVQFLVPVFPDLDKQVISVIATVLAATFRARHKLAENKPMAMDLCIVILVIGQIGTWLTNTDTLIGDNAPLPRPGLTYYDAITQIMRDIIVAFGMFWLGRAFVAGRADLIAMLRTLFGLALVYTVLCAIELRMSPQIHRWVYGFQHMDFQHVVRGGGFRPTVFMTHGLVLARFMASCVLAGILLWRLNALRKNQGWWLLWLILIFALCKSTGATILFLVFGPIAAFAKSANQMRFMVLIASIVAFYPALRGADYIPVDDLLDAAKNVSEQRAESLQIRFDNESALLERGRQRVWFGWGGYDRHQTYTWDGYAKLIVDGEWIGTFTSRGVIGFIGYYGLYLLPIFYARRRLRAMTTNDFQLMLGGFMLIAGLLIFDTLPNSSGTLPQFFWTGALAGAARGLSREESARRMKLREQRRAAVSEVDPAAA